MRLSRICNHDPEPPNDRGRRVPRFACIESKVFATYNSPAWIRHEKHLALLARSLRFARMFGNADGTVRITRMNDRRSRSQDVLSFGPFELFGPERLLKKADEPVPLGGRALDILIALAERAGEVVTHKELLSTAWPGVTVEEANLRFQMSTLRKALGDGQDGARYVSTVAGRGYCLVAPITRSTVARTVPVTAIAATERVQGLPPRLMRMVGRDDTVRSLTRQLQAWRFVS